MSRRPSLVQPAYAFDINALRGSIQTNANHTPEKRHSIQINRNYNLEKRHSVQTICYSRSNSFNGSIGTASTSKLDDLPEVPEATDEKKEIPFNAVSIITTFCRATSAHGYKYCDLAWELNHYACVALTIVVICITIMCLYIGITGLMALMEPDYYETQVKVISAVRTGLALPRLFISNAGLYNYSALREYNVSSYEAALLTSLLLGPVAHTPELRRNAKKVNRDYHNLLNRLNTSAADIWPLLSYKCEELVIDCVFINERVSGKTCCETRFISVLGNLGWSFLSTSEVRQEREAVSAGFTLNVRVPTQQLDMDWAYTNRDATVIQTGLRFNIINNHKDPNTASSSVVSLFSAMKTLVALSLTVHDNTGLHRSMFPWWNSNITCISPGSPYSVLATVRENCEANSVNLCSRSIRNCSDVSYPYWEAGGDLVCDFDDVFYLLDSNRTEACMNNHTQSCEKMCEEKVFSFVSQTSPLPDHDENNVQDSLSWYVNGSFTMYFSHLSYTQVSQSRPDILVVLGSLGGQGGLFQGISMITLTEMTTCLSCLLFCAIRACVRQYYT